MTDINKLIHLKQKNPQMFDRNLMAHNTLLNKMSATNTVRQHECFAVRLLQKNRESHFIKFCQPLADLNVLDVGCEDGYLTRKLAAEARQVIGVDLDIRMVKEAQKNTINCRTEFIVGDARKLPFKNESFDACVCGCVLPHVLNPQIILNELVRVTKTGGKIVLSVSNDTLLKYPKHFLKAVHLSSIIKNADYELPPGHIHEGSYKFLLKTIKKTPSFCIEKITGDLPLFPTMLFAIGYKT